MWYVEQHWVYEQRLLLGVEAREHPAHVWDFHVTLMKHRFLLQQQRTVRDSRVRVCLFVVIHAHHVAFGDEVEEDWSQEREEPNKPTESRLHRKAAHAEACLHEDEGHHTQTEHAAGVREKLHACKSNTNMELLNMA